MKIPTFTMLLTLALFFVACTSSDTAKTPTTYEEIDTKIVTQEATDDSETPQAPTIEDNIVLAWVDNLNIRRQPNIKSKVITQVKENTRLTLTGEKTDFTETISLRGIDYTEPWVEVKTEDGQTGWVFQGAVRQSNEDKGTILNTATKFAYPHFGEFDLSTWTKMPSRDDSGEELDIRTQLYQKEDQTLEIAIAERGEFYYGKTYQLFNAQRRLLKERILSISVDLDDNKLTEMVKDYTINPPKQFVRENDLKVHFSRLNPKPDMAKGTWTISNIESGATVLSTFSINDCNSVLKEDTGCACFFSTTNPYKGPAIFYNNMEDQACISVNGEMSVMHLIENDFQEDLKKKTNSKYWITLNEKGPTLYFGQPLASYGYDDEILFLTDAILASGKTIEAIPIQNNTVGMSIRELRDLSNDVIAKAKELRTQKLEDALDYMTYENQQYRLTVITRRMTNYEGEANKYEGQMILTTMGGIRILDKKVIKGTCGC